MADFDALSEWLSSISDRLSDDERTVLLRRIAQTLKSRHAQRIASNTAPSGAKFIPRKKKSGKFRAQKGKIKRGAMFKRSSRLLKTVYSSTHAEIGYNGRIADIMSVHQYGLTIRPSPSMSPTTYAVREVVGFGDEDIEFIKAEIERFLIP